MKARKRPTKSPRQIGAAQFKAECLSLLDKIDDEGLIITKNGKPVAKLVAIETDRNQYIGKFADRVRIFGDTLSTGVGWNAES